ncbi:MAG: hypothetical protein K2J60_03585 [Acetatifactor sp.]|nr:hypothetical protein [Acetatifactor sp.]
MEEKLFEKFGEFDSYAEINEAAEGLLLEGDIDSLRELAKENGLEEEAELYIQKQTEELCDPLTAALGKLKVEREEENSVFYDDVADYLMANCDDIEFAMAVRKNGKRISEAAERIWQEAKRNETTIGGHRCNYCGPMRGYQLIREYYAGRGEQ